MILQALTRYYEALAAQGEIAVPGWVPVRVSWALELNEAGELLALQPLEVPVERGKKTVLMPREMTLPMPEKRTVGVAANFLCDNCVYMLGIDTKGKPERALKCFEACRDRHRELLSGVDHPAARAVTRFFASWKPEEAARHPALAGVLDNLMKGGNLVFLVNDAFAQDVPEIRAAWDAARQPAEDAVIRTCLVTGQRAPIARLHPSIKKVWDAQPTGASLVSFNVPSFESYGCEGAQGLNAPVSEHAAFAYTAALNYLTAAENHRLHLGDMTVVYWSENGLDVYADAMTAALGDGIDDRDLHATMLAVAQGRSVLWHNLPVEPEVPFCILGLAPNASRLSVRFFLTGSFGDFARHLVAHHERMRIVRPAYEKWETLPVWAMLRETVNPNAKDKKPLPPMAGDVTRAILTDARYPETLMRQVQLRIRAEHDVSWGKAAILKAYLLKNTDNEAYREVLQVELNEQATYQPYLLGRMFAVLEWLQQAANPGINTTIKDKYFNAACATPATVFPTLIRLAQAHLRKLDGGIRVYHEKRLTELAGAMTRSYPARLSLEDQGIFQLGYYHQRQKDFTKKEDKNHE